MSCVYYRMSGPVTRGSPQASLSIEDNIIEGAPIRQPRRVVEYYDGETDSQCMWTTPKYPVREGYTLPNSIVYSLEGERDFLRRRETELDGEVTYLQAEVSRLFDMDETLQGENSELRADRVRTGDRLRKVTMDMRAIKMQLRKNDAYIARGMTAIRGAYENFEKATLVF